MKASVETVSGVEKRIRVEVPADEVSRRVEEGYAEVRKVAPLRGFRRGKAPMSMVRRVFKESVEADVAERLVRDSLAEAVKQNDLKVLSLPKSTRQVHGRAGVRVHCHTGGRPRGGPAGYKGIPGEGEREVREEDVDGRSAAFGSPSQGSTRSRSGGPASDLVEFGFTATAGDRRSSRENRRASSWRRSSVREGVRVASIGCGRGTKRRSRWSLNRVSQQKYAGKKVDFQVKVNRPGEETARPG